MAGTRATSEFGEALSNPLSSPLSGALGGALASVLVVGSINADLTFRAPARPEPGETVRADDVTLGYGGKGANLAVAAVLPGVRVSLLAACGSDEAGRMQVDQLARSGVDVGHVLTVPGPTGVAAVVLTPDGENSIVIAAGANAALGAAHVDALESVLAAPSVVVGQTEVPAAAVDAAAAYALRVGSRFVVNAAPVVELMPETLAAADPLVVNEHEAADLLMRAGQAVEADPVVRAWDLFAVAGPRSLVVTLGARGAVGIDGNGEFTAAAPLATVVDTTGAGDCFVGVLAASLALGGSLRGSVATAVDAAADSVTRLGARPVAYTSATNSSNAASVRW